MAYWKCFFHALDNAELYPGKWCLGELCHIILARARHRLYFGAPLVMCFYFLSWHQNIHMAFCIFDLHTKTAEVEKIV